MNEKELAEFEKRMNAKIDAVNSARSVVANPTTGIANSSEKALLSKFYARDLETLLQVNVADEKFRHVSEAEKFAVLKLKEEFDVARFATQIFTGQGSDPEVSDVRSLPQVRGILKSKTAVTFDLEAKLRAFGSTVVGQGDEWVPTVVSSSYIEEYELQKKLASAFKQIQMPSSPYNMPVQTGVTRARKIAEGAAITDSQFGTDVITFEAQKLGEYYILPEELNEDSAPSILTLARSEVIQSQVRAVEDALINGDDSGTHMDSDTTSGSSNRKLFKGQRKIALAASSTVTFAGGAITEPILANMRKLGGKYFANPKELCWVVSPSVAAQMLELPSVVTMEKFGPQATVLTGSIGIYKGIPIIVSEFIREDVNNTGVFDSVTVNKTTMHLVNLTRFYAGTRRPIKVRVQQDSRLEFDRIQLASYQRLDFKGHKQAGAVYASGVASTERSTVLGINILA